MTEPEDRWSGAGTWTEFTAGPDSTAVTEEVEPIPHRRIGFRPLDDED